MKDEIEKIVSQFRAKFPVIFKAANTSVALGDEVAITTIQTENVTDEDLASFFIGFRAAELMRLAETLEGMRRSDLSKGTHTDTHKWNECPACLEDHHWNAALSLAITTITNAAKKN